MSDDTKKDIKLALDLINDTYIEGGFITLLKKLSLCPEDVDPWMY